jgi:hypothetical protein
MIQADPAAAVLPTGAAAGVSGDWLMIAFALGCRMLRAHLTRHTKRASAAGDGRQRKWGQNDA